MRHGGEACIAANRFLVQRGIYEAFAKSLTERMERFNVGDGCAADTQCGSMINAAAVEKIERLVNDARGQGARVLLGGARSLDRPGFFYDHRSWWTRPERRNLKEEIFGPVAGHPVRLR